MNNIDKENSEFWNDICGSQLAKNLGIEDDSPGSLKKYDNFYLSYYSYLLKHVPVETFKGKKVLEVGLGYGTLSQQIAESGVLYHGLDIARGPVNMVNTRLSHMGLPATAQVGSIKECPFGDETFDAVVAIGCYHHTGDLKKAIEETFRILKKGGSCYLMVYNKYSYRQWINSPGLTLNRWLAEKLSFKKVNVTPTESERKAFDSNKQGEAAPETQFFSKAELGQIMKNAGFDSVHLQAENTDKMFFLGRTIIERESMLKNIGKWIGLDIYFQGKKK